MATKKPAAAPAKTPAKPAAKAAAAKTPAKAPAKAAAAPAPAKAAAKTPAKAPAKAKKVELPEVPVVGTVIEFAGYPEGTDEADMFLTAGERYEVIDVAESDDGTAYVVRCDNPDFDANVAESESNAAVIEVGVFDGEFTISADQTPLDAEAAPVETPAPVKAKGKAAAKAKAEVAPVEEEQAVEEVPELEHEDENVLALIDGAEDIVAVAQDLEQDIESKTFQLGGVLYHIKKEGGYKELDPAFAEKNGFAAFVEAYFKFAYRKAQHLINIYVTMNQLQIEDAASVVAEIGWTKASKIIVGMDEDNAADLIELARTNTVAQLSESLTAQNVNVGGTKGETKRMITLKLKYFEDEAAGIEDTLKSVMEEQGLTKIEDAFKFIVTEFKMAQGEPAPAAAAPKQTAAVATKRAAPAAKAAAAAPATSAKPAARRATAQAAA